MKRRGGRIATQFVRALVLMSVASVLASWIGLATIFHRAQVSSTARIQEASAHHIANLISDYVGSARRELSVFAESVGLSERSPVEIRAALDRLLIYASPTFSEIAMVDPSGRELAKASRFHTYLAGELSDLSAGGDAASSYARAAFAGAREGSGYMSDVHLSPEGGLLSVTLGIPLRTHSRLPEIELPKVLVVELNVTSLWMDVASIRIGETGYAYLVDSWGRFIAYQEPSTVLSRYGEDMRTAPPVAEFLDEQSALRSGTAAAGSTAKAGESGPRSFRYRGLRGQEVYGLRERVPDSDWAVVVELPVMEAMADFNRVQVFLGLVGGVGAILAGLLGAIVAARLSRPVASLIEAARRLDEGDMGDVPLELDRTDELGILARAFRSMQDSLRARSEDLAARLAELTEAKAGLQSSERKFRAIFEQTFELLGVLDPEGRLLEVNQTALDTIGSTRDEVIGKAFWETGWWTPFPDQAGIIREAVARVSQGQFLRFETHHLDSAGKPFHVDFSLKPVRDESDRVVLLIAEGRDITARKQAEEGIIASLREKEVLLREIHHRVKNNLQVIMSLLNLQATRISDPEVVRLYDETIGRVRTMAQVHELLYQSPSLSRVDLSEQVRLIAEDLLASYRHGLGEIGLHVEAEPVELTIEQALPCGLVVNEVLSNAFKYAFPKGVRDSGTVRIRLARRGEDIELELSDDGIGLPEKLEPGKSEGIGLSLVHLLVDQLRGSLAIDRSEGTRYLIQFRVAESYTGNPER